MGNLADMTQIPQDPADIERAIKAKQDHLADTVNELVYRAQPKQLADSAKLKARETAQTLLGVAKDRAGVVTENARAQLLGATEATKEAMSSSSGQTRPEAVVALGAGLTSALLFLAYSATRRK